MNSLSETATSGNQELLALAEEAYLWGYPLVQTGEYLRNGLAKKQPINQIVSGPAVLSAAYAPCIEVLYGFIFMDLTQEPQVLTVPDAGDRYYSFQFIDTFGNSYAYVGSRATGAKAGTYALVGPDWKGKLPAGVTAVPSPTNEVLVNIRTGVRDEDDLAAANAFVDSYALAPLSAYPRGLTHPIVSTEPLYEIFPILRFGHMGPKYFDVLGDRLTQKLPPREHAVVQRFAPLGIAPGRHPSQNPDLVATLAEAAKRAEQQLETCNFATRVNGWDVIYGITPAIDNTLLRAFTNRYGCGYHTAEEALYLHCRIGPDGKRLNGATKYVLRFAKGAQPPVNAFWSLALMDLAMIPVPNPINRFSLNSYTKGLVTGADGALEIQIQQQQPSVGAANWLPAPAGEFFMTLRFYAPKPAAITGVYAPPALVIV